MTQPKHTLGPYQEDEEASFVIIPAYGKYEDRPTIADLSRSSSLSNEEKSANTTLMIASPDLLTELMNLVATIEIMQADALDVKMIDLTASKEVIRQAIEGRKDGTR